MQDHPGVDLGAAGELDAGGFQGGLNLQKFIEVGFGNGGAHLISSHSGNTNVTLIREILRGPT